MQVVAPHLFGILMPSCWRSQMANGRGGRVSKEADTASRIPTAAKTGIVGGKTQPKKTMPHQVV